MLLIVATVSAIGLKGKEMWDHIEILWQQSKNYRPSLREQLAIVEVEHRFKKVYGVEYEKTVQGVVGLLVKLGLVIRYGAGEDEVLDIPDILPCAKV